MKTGFCQQFFIEVVLNWSSTECLIWPYSRDGRGYAKMWSGKHGKIKTVARLVCEHVYGPPPTSDHCTLHSCDKGAKGCVSRAHLRWGTHKENIADMYARERSSAKLTRSEVQEIKLIRGWTQQSIADLYGVSQVHISRIINLECWTEV